jgi:hypothetical protein
MVNMTATIIPQGPTVSLSLQGLKLAGGSNNSTTLTVKVPPRSTPGNYSVGVTASAGAAGSRMITVKVMVPDFTLAKGSAKVTILSGETGRAGLTVGSLYNFAGNVSFSAVVTPGGLTGFITPSIVMLSTGQAFAANLTVTGSTPGVFAVNVTGVSGLLTHSVTVKVFVQDFGISVDQLDSTVVAGHNETLTVRVTSLGGFNRPVVISSQTPSGLIVYPSLPVTPPSSSGLVLGGVSVANYTLVIKGSSGPLTHSVNVTVRVTNFSLVVGSSYLFVKVGVLANTTITAVGVNGFSGDVSLKVMASPGLMYALNTTRVSDSTYALLTVSAGIAGNYNATIQGSTASLAFRSLLLMVVVTDFKLSPSDLSVPCDVGASCTVTVNVEPLNWFNDTVALSTNSSPGLTATLSTASVKGSNNVILTMSAPTAGNYSVIVQGVSGSLSRSTGGIVLHVVDFALLVGELPAPIQAGFSAVSGIKIISANGFAGTVRLSVTVSPAGPRVMVNPTSLAVSPLGYGNASITIGLPQDLPPGIYSITLTVTDAGIQHSRTLSVRVVSPLNNVKNAGEPESPLLPVLEISVAALIGVALFLVFREYGFDWRMLIVELNKRLGRNASLGIGVSGRMILTIFSILFSFGAIMATEVSPGLPSSVLPGFLLADDVFLVLLVAFLLVPSRD